MPRLKIRFPSSRHDDDDKAIPSKFVAAGRVKAKVGNHKIIGVEAELRLNPPDGPLGDEVDGEPVLRRFAPDGNGGRHLRWVIHFTESVNTSETPQRFHLEVHGLENDGAGGTRRVQTVHGEVDFWVGPAGGDLDLAPSVEYPPSGHEIQEQERDYFIAFGSSDLPIIAITLGDAPAAHIEWYQAPDNFWWAEFIGLGVNPGSDEADYRLKVSNADGDTPPEYRVTIEED